MTSALIGHTGFVGSNLVQQAHFDAMFNSANIEEIRGSTFDRVVCAGIRAIKWWANAHPDEDLMHIAKLTSALETVRARSLVLISTVDVYPRPFGVDEMTEISRDEGEPYGRHRLAFEDKVRHLFETVRIIRLPALFGAGLKKNVLYDMITNNRLEYINPDSSFQWYDLSRLAADIHVMEEKELALVNLSVQPIKTVEIQKQFFPSMRIGGAETASAYYEMRSLYSSHYGGENGFMISSEETLERMGLFIQSCER